MFRPWFILAPLNGPLNGHPPSTLLKVVGYYDLSVLSMSVMGSMGGGLVDGVSSIHFFVFF